MTVTVLVLAALVICNLNSLSADDSLKPLNTDVSAKDVNGPTLELSYGQGEEKINSTPNFMYFVPLISPTLVDGQTSKDNCQLSKIISRNVKTSGNDFYVECEFQMWGKGTHKNTFDSQQMIKRNIGSLKGEKPIKNVLGYIKFDGEGYGIISIEGQIIDSKPIVTKVVVDFSSREAKSPVIIGLYSVNPVNGEYKYENRFGTIVARIDTLSFERTKGNPMLAIRVESIADDEISNGFWGSVKGMIANFFIEPITINPKGNDAMLDFGLALYQSQKSYTFPIAENLKTTDKN
jgi:hypothetical protein